MRRVDATAYAVQPDALEVIVTTQKWVDIEAVTIVIDGQLDLVLHRSQGHARARCASMACSVDQRLFDDAV